MKILTIGKDPIPSSVVLGEGETLEMTLLALPGTCADVEMSLDLSAPGARADLAGLYVLKGSDSLNLKVTLTHSSGECTSRQLFKGVVDGSARFAFDGLIKVEQDAQKTSALQENHTILLSETAHAQTRPQLEIYADDVECSHGATVGYLSEEELFYMRSRGIPEAEAKALQTISFLSPVLSRLPEEMKEQVLSQL